MVIGGLELTTITYAFEYFLKKNNLLSNAGSLMASLWCLLVRRFGKNLVVEIGPTIIVSLPAGYVLITCSLPVA